MRHTCEGRSSLPGRANVGRDRLRDLATGAVLVSTLPLGFGGASRQGGSMTRDASLFLASVCADYLVDRLALAGVAAVRRASE